MDDTIQIDGAGRVVLPKAVRERFRLAGGDALSIEVKGDVIELRPRKMNLTLKKVNGVLVVAGPKLPAERDLVSEDREDRLQELLRQSGFKG